jgi:ParB family transcriptional regulator, chromosome partitioning protein
MPDKGHIALERQIGSITVGVRHRRDLGDMSALMRSIEEVGLLQPITVTPDGVLVCGLRRLEAMRRLGKRTLSVWVRSGISDQLAHLLAQQDENEQRKPLSPVETARLYEEIKVLEKEDSERRQAVTRFGRNGSDGDMNGGDESPPPHGKTRSIAAHILTGTDASQRLERINWIRSVSEDNSLGESVREFAANMLSEIDNDAPVSPAYKRVKAAVELASKPPPPTNDEQDEVNRLAAEALKRVQEENAKRLWALRNKAKRAPRHHSPRSFTLMWSELEGWSELYDVNELAGSLKDDEWARFERVVTETIDLRDRLREARTAAASA